MAYTTPALVKSYLAITSTADDNVLSALCARAQAIVDQYCQRTFEASGNTTRYFDAKRDVEGLTLYVDHDLYSVNSVTNGDATTVTAAKYVTEPRNSKPIYAITLLPSAEIVWEPNSTTGDTENAIAISGKWAYSESAPDQVIQATTRLAAYFYKQRDASVFDVTATPELGIITVPQGIPVDVQKMLDPLRRLV